MLSAASSKKRDMASSSKKFRPSKRFTVSFKALHETTSNPNSAPIRDRSETDYQRDPLSRFNQWPLNKKPADKAKFIERDKTTRKAAVVCLKELMSNYVAHTLEHTNSECPKNQE